MFNAHRIAGRPRGRTARVTRRGAGASWRGFVLSVGAVCVPAAALLVCAGEARAQTDDVEHWSATLTRGAFIGGSGYNHWDFNTYGSLTSTTFTHADVSYTVLLLSVATAAGGELEFSTDPSLPLDADLSVRIPTFRTASTTECPVGGTLELELSDSLHDTESFGDGYRNWPDLDNAFACFSAEDWNQNLATTGTVTLLGPPVPAATGVAVTSTPRLTSAGATTPDTYGRGERIEFTVTFDYPVSVSGDPRFPFSLGNLDQEETVYAAYSSGGGSTSLVFAYTVQGDDTDSDGICLCVDTEMEGSWSLDLDSNDEISGTGAGAPNAVVTLTGADGCGERAQGGRQQARDRARSGRSGRRRPGAGAGGACGRPGAAGGAARRREDRRPGFRPPR